jgi:hypothetical protein
VQRIFLEPKYPPVRRDPTTYIDLEASVVQLGQSYILHSVNLILTDLISALNLGVEIHTKPEETVVVLNDKGERVVARWDLEYSIRRTGALGAWSTTAIVEFKRPLSLKYKNWATAMKGTNLYAGQILKPDLYIVQQSKKYNEYGKTSYVALYNWVSFVELVNLDGLAEGSPSPPVSKAFYRWTDARQGHVRLQLFQFLFKVLMAYVGPSGQTQVQRILQYT